MKNSVKTDSVRTVVQSTFELDDNQTEEVIARIIADEEANAEPKEEKAKREKRYAFLVPDPDGIMATTQFIKNGIAGFIVELMPTRINGDGVYDSDAEPREWGELEAEKLLETIVERARDKHFKKGPYECVGDVIDRAPKKFLKEMGLSPVTTAPVAVIPVCPENLYTDSKTRKNVGPGVDILQ